MKITLRTALGGPAAALLPAMILSSTDQAQAAYNGLSVELHTTVLAGGTLRSVYRVYANFDDPDDQLFTWHGFTTDPVVIESRDALDLAPGSNFYNPGGLSSNTAPTLAQIHGSVSTPPIPNIEWGTFATIGVSIAEQGSGPTIHNPATDQTLVNPGFPEFIQGNSFVHGVSVYALPPATQGEAGYAADGDLALRVLMMQLTVNLGDNVRGNLDVNVFLDGVEVANVFEDQTFNSFIPAPGVLSLLVVAGAMPARRRRRMR